MLKSINLVLLLLLLTALTVLAAVTAYDHYLTLTYRIAAGRKADQQAAVGAAYAACHKRYPRRWHAYRSIQRLHR